VEQWKKLRDIQSQESPRSFIFPRGRWARTKVDWDQFSKLKEFREEIENKDFCGSFADLQSFKDRFRDHLDNTIYRRFISSAVAPVISPRNIPTPPASSALDKTNEADVLRFTTLQEMFLEIDLSVSRTATPWKREQRRKIIRMPRSFIEREGFEWNHRTLLESGPFRTLVMHKARRSDDADFNWYLQSIRYLGENAKLPEEKPHQLGDDCWILDIPDPAKDL